MGCVLFDVGAEVAANGAGLCSRVGPIKPPLADGVVGLKNHDNDWSAGHKRQKVAEKGALGMHGRIQQPGPL